MLDLEDKSTTTLQNVGNSSPNNTTPHPGRPESLTFLISGQGDGGEVKRRREEEKEEEEEEEEEKEEEEKKNYSHQSHLHE